MRVTFILNPVEDIEIIGFLESVPRYQRSRVIRAMLKKAISGNQVVTSPQGMQVNPASREVETADQGREAEILEQETEAPALDIDGLLEQGEHL